MLHREKPPNVGGVRGSAWDATPDWETEPKMRASITRKALGVALVAVVAVVIVEGTGVGAASIHRHRAFIY